MTSAVALNRHGGFFSDQKHASPSPRQHEALFGTNFTPTIMKHIILLAISLALALPLHAGNKHAGAKEKAKPNLARVFKKRDKDGDGFLSKEEFLAGRKQAAKAEKAFNRRDKDSDGKLSRTEFTGKKHKAAKNKAAKKQGAKAKKKAAGKKHK